MYAAFPTSMIQKIELFPEISTVLDLLSWLTIIFTFFNGYIINETRTIVLEPKRIAWHYVSGVYFTCDVLSSIPIFPIIHFCEVFFHTRLFIGIGVLYAFCELKLIRVVSVIQFISTIVIVSILFSFTLGVTNTKIDETFISTYLLSFMFN
nr:unnamed protein product [Callosobruchus chinensis]